MSNKGFWQNSSSTLVKLSFLCSNCRWNLKSGLTKGAQVGVQITIGIGRNMLASSACVGRHVEWRGWQGLLSISFLFQIFSLSFIIFLWFPVMNLLICKLAKAYLFIPIVTAQWRFILWATGAIFVQPGALTTQLRSTLSSTYLSLVPMLDEDNFCLYQQKRQESTSTTVKKHIVASSSLRFSSL